jgi:hypothetical protein
MYLTDLFSNFTAQEIGYAKNASAAHFAAYGPSEFRCIAACHPQLMGAQSATYDGLFLRPVRSKS